MRLRRSPQNPTTSRLRTFWNAACLGGGVGSLYSAVMIAQKVPEDDLIIAFLSFFLGGALLSTPLLFLVTLLMGPLMIAWLGSIQRQRTLCFAFVGGFLGAGSFITLILLAIATGLFQRSGNLSSLIIYFQLSTIGFGYGAATAAFVSLDLGNRQRP